jgi:hypothetical protein
MKFTPSGGSVTLSVSARRVSVVESEVESLESGSGQTGERATNRTLVNDPVDGKWDEIHVSVRDTGPGVGRQMVDRLFQPFTQGDGSFSRKAGGTGLGLAISKQLVTLLGGRIWLDDSVTDGSSFHFTVVGRNVLSYTPPQSPRDPPASLLAMRRPSLGLPLPPQITSPVVMSASSSPTHSADFAAVASIGSTDLPRVSTAEGGGKRNDGRAQLVKSASQELTRSSPDATTVSTPQGTVASSTEVKPQRPVILGKSPSPPPFVFAFAFKHNSFISGVLVVMSSY